MKRTCICVLFLSTAAAVLAGSARADGLPVLGVDVGSTGVVSRTGDARYVTLPAGRDNDTVLARVNPRGGQVLTSTVMPGTFTIPAVAYDGSADGLSADGRTLVLIEPRVGFPRRRTTLLVVEARRLRFRKLVRLKGDFSFDAISPHGRLVYLIQYTSPSDPTRYLVRAYDLRASHLLAKPVTDPNEQSDKMRGNPLTRVTSPDGRWAYTLYDGAGTTPFVHALDTKTRGAHCIDLPPLRGSNNLWSLRFHLDRTTLTLGNRGRPVLAIDTRTFVTSTPTSPGAPGDSDTPWLLICLSILASLAVAALAIGVRRATRPRRSPARAS